jgi:MFS family permease
MQNNIKLLKLHYFFIGFSFISAFLAIYFAKITGSYALAMSIFSVALISSAIFEIPTGTFSDMIGRKNTIVLGSLAILLSAILYALGRNYLILLLGGVFEGLARSFFSGNNNAFLYDSLSEEGNIENFDEQLGKIGFSEQLALGISAIIGGIIASYSLNLAAWLSIIPCIFLLLISLKLTDTKKHLRESANVYSHIKDALVQFKNNYRLKLLTASASISYAFGEASFQFRPIFIASLWPLWAVGISNTLSHIGGSLSFYYSGKIIKKFKALNYLIFSGIINRVINFAALIFPTIASPAIMTLTSLQYGPSEVAENSLFQKEFTDKERATMGSINSLVGSLLFGIVAFGLGFVADKIGPTKSLILIQFAMFVPTIILWKVFKHENKKVI